MTEPFWSWLHGPADNPYPRVGDVSASCAASLRPEPVPRVPWDEWLHEQIRNHAEGAA